VTSAPLSGGTDGRTVAEAHQAVLVDSARRGLSSGQCRARAAVAAVDLGRL
jgi:hypothetical protein